MVSLRKGIEMESFHDNMSSSIGLFYSVELFILVILTGYLSFKTLERKKSQKNILDELPGPRRLPIIGGAYVFLAQRRDFLSNLLCVGDKYGALFKVDLFSEKVVFLNSPESTKKLLSSSNMGHLRKADELYRVPLGDNYFGNGLVTSSGETWKSHRNIIGRAFTGKWYKSYVQIFNKHATHLITELGKISDGKVFHSGIELIHETSFKVITEVVLGEPDGDFGAEFGKAYERRNQMFSIRASNPIFLNEFLWNVHPFSFQVAKLENQLKGMVLRLIGKAKKRHSLMEEDGDESQMKTMIDTMLDSDMSDDDILYECNTIIAAGFDSSSWTLTHCLFFLATHPHIQAECRKEVDRLFLDEGKCPQGEFTMETLDELETVERCLLETLRLVPIFYIYLRKLDVPLMLEENVEIPVGTNVAVVPWMLHRNKKQFPLPEEFNPDRFLKENVAKRHSHSFAPFSLGMRGCIGTKFAIMEMKTLMAHILFNFEVSTDDKFGVIRMVPDFVVKPEREYKLKFRKRV